MMKALLMTAKRISREDKSENESSVIASSVDRMSGAPLKTLEKHCVFMLSKGARSVRRRCRESGYFCVGEITQRGSARGMQYRF